ncbi:MAG: hypothetical protein IAE78_23380 [Myxococcus sp.]|nr:hypothetical protein [Myxococcus sp.]
MLRHLIASLLLAAGCAPARAWVPPPPAQPADVTLVWVGTGECERFVDGRWVRAPQFDYDFSVEQRRGKDRWDSVKSLRRRHPDYDGSAGERTLTWFFQLDLGQDVNGKLPMTLTTSLGAGVGSTDREFREAVLELDPKLSTLAPFDRYRITQRYHYEDGRLDEVVSLDKGTTPWVRNVERATLFGAHAFAAPPTTR